MSIISKADLWQVASAMPAEMVELHDSNGVMIGSIKMRGLTGAELTAYQESLVVTLSSGQRKPNTRHAMSKLIVLCAINEDGSLYFDSKADMLRLDDAPARMLMPLFESAQRLCGLTDDDFKQMVADFDTTQSDHSDSD